MTFVKNKIAYWNCGGGIKSKHSYLENLLKSEGISLIFISESEVLEGDLGILKIDGYDLINSNTLDIKSRLSCYIHNTIRYKRVKIDDKIDMIALDIEDFRVIGLYRPFKLPPNSNRIPFFQSIIQNLYKLASTDRQLVIGGDFNVDLDKKSSNLSDLQNWSIKSGLQQLVVKKAWQRVVSGTVQTSSIDHVYTNNLNISLTQVPSVSDHDLLLLSKEFERVIRTKIIQRDWRGYSKETVNEELNKKMSQMSITSDQLDYDSLVVVLNDLKDILAPKRVIRVRDGQVISQKLEKLKKRRDRLFRRFRKTGSSDSELLNDIKKLNKDIKKCINNEKRRIFQNKAMSPDPKVFCQAVNSSLGKTKDNDIVIVIEMNGVLVTKGCLHSLVTSLSVKSKVILILNQPY
jgi:exonuclease III